MGAINDQPITIRVNDRDNVAIVVNSEDYSQKVDWKGTSLKDTEAPMELSV
jgi:hypothetical protein